MNRIDWQRFRKEFADAASGAGLRREIIAETACGPMDAWVGGDEGPLYYLSSGIHGDEPAGPLAMLRWLRSGLPEVPARWALVPMLNPSGLEANTRYNLQGVDLNRDYLARKSDEVAAHVAWLQGKGVPDLFVSLHEDWEASGFYLYEIRVGEAESVDTRILLAAARSILPLEPGPLIDGHQVREAGWIDHAAESDEPEGWPEAIYLCKMGCPLSFTLETSSQVPLERRVSCHVAVLDRLFGRGTDD